MTKILVISDTHSKHGLLTDLPEADILVHGGDFMNSGRYEMEILSFNRWLDTVPVPRTSRLICAGNHDIRFDAYHPQSSPQAAKKARELLTNGVYLQDQSITVRGIKFYFSPWTPEFCGWGFNAKRGKELEQVWKRIPDDTQFLVTHGPPYGILDQIFPEYARSNAEHLGCEELAKRVSELKHLKYHVFGHIHGGRGTRTSDGTTFINAAVLNERYELADRVQPYFLVEI